MEISSVGSIVAAVSQAPSGDDVGIAVLKKALDFEAQSALQLIQALPQPAASGPANLGQGVNTFA